MQERNKILYGFIFHQGLDGVWSAVDRNEYFHLFNDRSKVKYRSSDIHTLQEMIVKTNGDPSKLDEILTK